VGNFGALEAMHATEELERAALAGNAPLARASLARVEVTVSQLRAALTLVTTGVGVTAGR
jgi:hypothetical protein